VPATERLAVFPARAGHEVLSLVGFGGWNACPRAAEHVARAMRWQRDLGARLEALGHDFQLWSVARPPERPAEILRLSDERGQLHPDERPRAAELAVARRWYLWWD